ncbi:DUF1566 domain-containing protein [Sorangium sp. So ce185]|uniref:Lcl domain-containing protein n=1 Tax=Sorangium sp. So ce185 TaxID=3133287 RepID=UPI003F618C92
MTGNLMFLRLEVPRSGADVLARTIVFPAAVAKRRGPLSLFARIPPHERLGGVAADRGLPIGNLTSQSFANVYLDALDQFVKRRLGVEHDVRYVDDVVLLHTEAAVLRAWEGRIRTFLGLRLSLEAHPVREVRPVAEGVDFVGYIVRPGDVSHPELSRRGGWPTCSSRRRERRWTMKRLRSKVPGHGWVAAAGLATVVFSLVRVPSAEADASCDARYTISEDTVRDNDTGLTWQRQVDGGEYAWSDASLYCKGLQLSGAGWRLPTVFELQTLVDDSRGHPAIDEKAFPETPYEFFWSSSSLANDPNRAWYVSFDIGDVNSGIAGSMCRVRCVR